MTATNDGILPLATFLGVSTMSDCKGEITRPDVWDRAQMELTSRKEAPRLVRHCARSGAVGSAMAAGFTAGRHPPWRRGGHLTPPTPFPRPTP
jgi:hypothetical protein